MKFQELFPIMENHYFIITDRNAPNLSHYFTRDELPEHLFRCEVDFMETVGTVPQRLFEDTDQELYVCPVKLQLAAGEITEEKKETKTASDTDFFSHIKLDQQALDNLKESMGSFGHIVPSLDEIYEKAQDPEIQAQVTQMMENIDFQQVSNMLESMMGGLGGFSPFPQAPSQETNPEDSDDEDEFMLIEDDD